MGSNNSKEEEVLFLHDQGICTELDTISHQFIIDIARPSLSFNELFQATKSDLQGGKFADQIGDDFDYQSELSEMALPHIKHVVYDYQANSVNQKSINKVDSALSGSTSVSGDLNPMQKALVKYHEMHQTEPVIVPRNPLNVDLLIESMKAMFKELNPEASIDNIIQIFNKHVSQAEDAMRQGDNELHLVEHVQEIELSMTLAMQFYLGYFDEGSGNYDNRGGQLISLAGMKN